MPAGAEDEAGPPSTAHRPDHLGSEEHHGEQPPPPADVPPLPEGMSLDDVLERAAQPPPETFPSAVPDDAFRAFVLVEQLEYPAAAAGNAGQRVIGNDNRQPRFLGQ